MSEPRFLVVRLGSLGDIVHTFPAVAALRSTFPSAEIIWLTHPRWEELVASSGLAQQIWTVETRSLASVRQAIRRIRSTDLSCATDYQGLWKSAALPFLGQVKKRIGFSSETIREFGVPLLYTQRVRTKSAHIAEQNGELSLAAGAALPVDTVTIRVPVEAEEKVRERLRQGSVERYVVLSPGGGWQSKCWPAARYGALCVRIGNELGLPCVLNYGPGEENLVAAVKEASGDFRPFPYNGSLGELMALLRSACCVVGGDTGPLHLAAALGSHVVALFGPTDPARNGPYPREENIVLRSPSAKTTYKRGEQPDDSILKIDVDAVFEAVRRTVGAIA